MKKAQRLEFTIVVRPATGGLWRAHMKDDDTVKALGESPMIAIRNLAIQLQEEEDRTSEEKARN